MSVNVTPPSIGPTVNVSVDPLAVQRAEAAAAAAEAAKAAAETAATTAASSAAAAASSKTDAEAAAAAASASESAAAASQAAAAASAAAALASEIAAGTSETNAAISAAAAAASQSAAAASAAAAAASESAAAASAAAAAASESAAAASASAASTSETNAAASAATATTQAGIATTKAGEAATSATDAEAAKDAVEAITDFTAGNTYRANGTGIEAVNEKLSPLAQFGYGVSAPDLLYAADNFLYRGLRPASDLTGKAYTDLTVNGDSFITLDTSGLPADNNSRNFIFHLNYQTRIISDKIFFLLYKDATNYIIVKFIARYNIEIVETVAGVSLIKYQSAIGIGDAPERHVFYTKILWDNRDGRLYIYDDFRKGSFLISSAIPTNGDLNKFGFFHTSVFGNAQFNSYRADLK